MEFWNESVTDRAWKVLIKLVNKFDYKKRDLILN